MMAKENIQDHYKEIDHSADVALQVWAHDFSSLLHQAGLGMLHLMGVDLDQLPKEEEISATFMFTHLEDVLVQGLNEVLFYLETDGVLYLPMQTEIVGQKAQIHYLGGKIESSIQEIKAVTYHQMQIHDVEQGLETIIVFDV